MMIFFLYFSEQNKHQAPNIMDIISSTFESRGLRLRKGPLGNYYPGSCDQCQMKKMGFKTILYGLTPELSILLCDSCYNEVKTVIEKTIKELQTVTFYSSLMGFGGGDDVGDDGVGNQAKIRGKEFRFVDEKGVLQEGWRLHPGYLLFVPHDGTVYIPLWKLGHEEKQVSLRHFIIMNDVPLFSRRKQ